MAGQQFVERASAANILVVEDGGRGITTQTDQLVPELLLDLRCQRPTLREELGHPGKSMSKSARARGRERQREGRAIENVSRLSNNSPASYAAHLIGTPLFARGNLRHRGDEDVGESGCGSALRGDPAERPRAALIIHDPARAIDRVEQTFPLRVGHASSSRKALRLVRTFHDDFDRLGGRPMQAEPLFNGFFAELVDGIDRVRDRLVRHGRKAFARH